MIKLELSAYLDHCPKTWQNMIHGLKASSGLTLQDSLPFEILDKELNEYKISYINGSTVVLFEDDHLYQFWLLKWA